LAFRKCASPIASTARSQEDDFEFCSLLNFSPPLPFSYCWEAFLPDKNFLAASSAPLLREEETSHNGHLTTFSFLQTNQSLEKVSLLLLHVILTVPAQGLSLSPHTKGKE
jgi:hypothetical protein